MRGKAKVLTTTSLVALMVCVGVGSGHAQQAKQPAGPAQSASGVAHGAAVQIPVNVDITYQELLGADQNPNNWMLYGRTYDNQRYSPLDQVNASNVGSLSPVAIIQTGVSASFEVSPIIDNGIMFISTPYDHVMAYD
ncbi:MAG: hypothetical protein ACREF3_18280, partial [Acetobacteraceae bacterium]